MTGSGAAPNIQWDTLKLSAEPLRTRNDMLVVAHVRVRQHPTGYDEYRVNFEMNKLHGLVSYDTEVMVPKPGAEGPRWRYSGRRDLIVTVKDHFLRTQLYAHVAGQLGWIPASGAEIAHAPLDP